MASAHAQQRMLSDRQAVTPSWHDGRADEARREGACGTRFAATTDRGRRSKDEGGHDRHHQRDRRPAQGLMQLIDGRPAYSATDLVGFLACEHLTDLERAAVDGLVARPHRPDPELDRIRIRGEQHEARYLRELEASGRRVRRLSIPEDAWRSDRGAAFRDAAEATRRAVQEGADVVYQACFFDGRWLGFADFLLRVERPTNRLPWSYEVVDTKLARSTKASAVLQMCSYVEQLERMQAGTSEWMHVALGGSARAVEHLRVADYMAYYRTVKSDFEAAVGIRYESAYPPLASYPEPVEHCGVCRWALVCRDRRRADDDLSLVAGIAARTRKELKARGITRRRQLAVLELPLVPRLERTGAQPLHRVREQARIQVEGEDAGGPRWELLDPKPTESGALDTAKGLLALPEPSLNDLFLDLEGDPFALDDGVDYLFGILEPGRSDAEGNPLYHSFWARDEEGRVTPQAEKRAFEQALDLISDRLTHDPTLHVYHFAPYEPTALGRLMGRYTTREVEIDRLKRGDTLIDLFRVVRQGVRASVESYSIKRLEPLYGYEREVDLRDAGSSIVAFETWLEVGGEGGRDDETLSRIERYNRDDVVSTWHLRDWLEVRRQDLERRIGAPVARPAPKSGAETERLAAWLERVRELAVPLAADVPLERAERSEEQQARWLLAQLLGWHRREQKASWWRFFYLTEDLTDEERIDENEPLSGLQLLGTIDAEKLIYRYGFPQQEHRLEAGRSVRDPEPEAGATLQVVSIDDAQGEVVLDHPKRNDGTFHHPTSVVPETVVPTQAQEEALLRVAAAVLHDGIDGDGPYRAARHLLLRRPPRTGHMPGTRLCQPGEAPAACARRAAAALDASYLAIQGPPGSGKTYTGARIIVDLVEHGRRVAITANSHKVIGNLLDEVDRASRERGMVVRLGQKPDSDGVPTCEVATCFKSNDLLRAALTARTIDVAGATAWTWAREGFERSVDVLVIDEAGQFSLANMVSVGGAARSLILLGDPQQLDQPIQGSHPAGAEKSALGHLLEGGTEEPPPRTMPPELGLFLERTWRLHPRIASYTSEAFYESKLEAQPGNERQDLKGAGLLDGVGLRRIFVEHQDGATDSPEEARVVAGLVEELLHSGATWVDRDGLTHPIARDDVLIVTPYNAHKALIEKELGRGRIGTVDKFQGQQAPVSIYSMGTSAPELAPRGLGFLYSLNRLNVATSRARCLAVVVCSPALLRVRCATPKQMRLANALCLAVEHAMEADLPVLIG